MYTDAMAAATRRQSDVEITHVFKNQNKARCEHAIIYINEKQQAVEKTAYRLSPESDA